MRAVSPKVQLGACKDLEMQVFSAHDLVPVVWSGTFGSRVSRAWVEDGQRAEGGGGLEEFRGFASSAGRCVAFPVRAVAGFRQRKQLSRQPHPSWLVGKMTQPGRSKMAQRKRDPRMRSPCILAHCTLQQFECNLYLTSRSSRVIAFDIVLCRDSKKSIRAHAYMGFTLKLGVFVSARQRRSSPCPNVLASGYSCLARGLALPDNWAASQTNIQGSRPAVSMRAYICFHPGCISLHFPVCCSAGLELADAWPVLTRRRFIGKVLLVELKTQLFFSTSTIH